MSSYGLEPEKYPIVPLLGGCIKHLLINDFDIVTATGQPRRVSRITNTGLNFTIEIGQINNNNFDALILIRLDRAS